MGRINKYQEQLNYIHKNLKCSTNVHPAFELYEFENDLFKYQYYKQNSYYIDDGFTKHFFYIEFDNKMIKIVLFQSFDKTLITKIENFLARKLYYHERIKMG